MVASQAHTGGGRASFLSRFNNFHLANEVLFSLCPEARLFVLLYFITRLNVNWVFPYHLCRVNVSLRALLPRLAGSASAGVATGGAGGASVNARIGRCSAVVLRGESRLLPSDQ